MKKLFLVLAMAGLLALPSLAAGQQLINFNGQALVPVAVGNDATAYLPVDDSGTFDSPVPLDFANFEYTLVITGLTLDAINGAAQDYLPGSITLYEDDGTAADFANPATFTDGTVALTGSLAGFSREMFSSTLGSGQGDVDWTGGSLLGSLAPGDQTGWSFLVTISTRASAVEPGYDENWDGKVEPLAPISVDGEVGITDLKFRHQ